jgi:hypothetical protein
MKNWEGHGGKRSSLISRYYSGICLVRLRNTKKNLRRHNRLLSSPRPSDLQYQSEYKRTVPLGRLLLIWSNLSSQDCAKPGHGALLLAGWQLVMAAKLLCQSVTRSPLPGSWYHILAQNRITYVIPSIPFTMPTLQCRVFFKQLIIIQLSEKYAIETRLQPVTYGLG